MSETLLPYYNRELAALRVLAAEFARAYPKIAGRLRLADDAVDDPHVARLLEGVAFLAARVHHRLDDELPELTDALLGVLYPHYLNPVPSAAIARFTAPWDAAGPTRLPAGLMLETERVRDERCSFRTTHALDVWPVKIEAARLSGLPLPAPEHPKAPEALAVLRVTLGCANPDMTLQALGIDRLRLFVGGQPAVAQSLFELLAEHTIGIALADGPTDPQPTLLPPDSLSPCGFAPEEALLPWPARSFEGFRLLTEYFTLPEKFRFLEIAGLRARTLLAALPRLDLFFYLDRALPELERLVDAEALMPGCVPIVNLFPQSCEPVALTHTETEYRIEASARRPAALEIWSVDRVRETRGDGAQRDWAPFYRLAPEGAEAEPGAHYRTIRRASPSLTGSDLFLEPYDPEFDPLEAADSVLSVDATCFNRDLPADLPRGGGHPHLSLAQGLAGVAAIACVTPPTPTMRAELRQRRFWPLVSHLALGHLSVVGGPDGARALREVLRLYDLRDSAETRNAIAGLLSVSARPGAARVPLPPGGGRLPPSQAGAFVRGIDVTLEWDRRAWHDGGLYLLASVLERFLALHATVNAFVRTTCTLRGEADPIASWPARAGTRVLV